MADRLAQMETPCIKMCMLDVDTELCAGCGRSLDEIASWARLSDAERSKVMAELPQRMEKIRRD
jgi:predicted Fe-S protein YdhL (DUF1289 family)